jgi:hypothetical protein
VHPKEIDFRLFKYTFYGFKKEGVLFQSFQKFMHNLTMQLLLVLKGSYNKVIHIVLEVPGVFLP